MGLAAAHCLPLPPVISVQHLTRRFGSLTAISDLSFEIEQGEVVGFLGPNGAGKTTCLRILAGFLPATSGGASVAGFDVLKESLEVRRRIGYLAETVPLYNDQRVEEMLGFQGQLHSLSRSERARRIPAVLERVGLLDRRRQMVGQLSRGLRQRVGLAVALLPEPEVLILDEPTSGLDPLQRIEVRGLIQELALEHTVLLSSHILPEIEAVCPRVMILSEGRLAADGTHAQLVETLGGGSCVRFEAALGAEVQDAQRLLAGIPGAQRVDDRGRLGIHHCFDIQCDEDLREDIGALAAQRGWALRELSWQKPTLEELFARIALGFDGDRTGPTGASTEESPPPGSAPVQIDGCPSGTGGLGEKPTSGGDFLNPFNS
jgi:ABC-2 type transport system ATP-binding protein